MENKETNTKKNYKVNKGNKNMSEINVSDVDIERIIEYMKIHNYKRNYFVESFN